MQKKPDPGKSKIKEEYAEIEGGRIVRKRFAGMHFIFGGELHVAIGPCLENPNRIVAFINNRFIALKLNEGCLLGHAAGLAPGGFFGAGKSTLALHLMSRGVTFISSDPLIVTQNCAGGLKMFGVAKLPRVKPVVFLDFIVMESDDARYRERLNSERLIKLAMLVILRPFPKPFYLFSER